MRLLESPAECRKRIMFGSEARSRERARKQANERAVIMAALSGPFPPKTEPARIVEAVQHDKRGAEIQLLTVLSLG